MLKTLLDAAAKRGMDLALAGAGIAVTWPAMVVIAAAIAWQDKDTPWYVQERVGKDGKRFWLLKFRTMRAATPGEDEPEITVGQDPRITRVGKLLRGARLDELPQLFNIIVGDLSVVGPRPEVPRYVAHTTKSSFTPSPFDPA